MNYAYLFVDNLGGHSYQNGLEELKASVFSLKKIQNYDFIHIFNNETSGKNIEYFQKENIIHNHINLSRNYGGSNNINPINILVEKIICLMNFDENEDITLIDIDTEFQRSIPNVFWNQNYIVFDNVEYPIMEWRNLDKILPNIPWKTFDINFDSSFLMYNTGVIHLPKKFRKELCEKALKIVDYLNHNFSPEDRCGNKLDEQIALSIVCHDTYGRFGNIRYSRDYIHHHWKSKHTGEKWWKKYDLVSEESKYETFISMHSQSCLDLISNYKSNLKDKVIIDVGSNIGLFAKSIAENISYNHIHLFEPCIEYLNKSKTLLKNFKNITYNNIALGDCKEEKTLYKSKDSNIGWNTLYDKDPNQNENFFNEMNSEIVSTVRLDDYYKDIKQIDFIKIDVEGYERNVLEGSWNLIQKFKPHILIEVGWGINHPDWNLNKKTYEKLFSLGYEKFDLDSIQNTQDILFKPKNNSIKLPLSVGILSWNSYETLRNTLETYKLNGLFDLANDVTLFFQECSEEDINIANEYQIPFIAFEENIGIGRAFVKLCQIARTDNVLLLEHDWELIENENISFERLKSGIDMLDHGYDCIRYRHRENPGYPLYSKDAYIGNELNHYDNITDTISPHLMECCHWIDDLHLQFPDKIQKVNDYYVTTGRWSCFTNNPCMYKKDFYLNKIYTFKEKSLLLENDISYWWVRQNFKVAWGKGLFKHNDIEKYGNSL